MLYAKKEKSMPSLLDFYVFSQKKKRKNVFISLKTYLLSYSTLLTKTQKKKEIITSLHKKTK